jgi:opacity protein-like surface antigen
MKLKIIITVVSIILLSKSLFANSNDYIGIIYGKYSANKNLYKYSYEEEDEATCKIVKYEEAIKLKLIGLEYQLIGYLNNNVLMWGFGTGVMLNDGDFANGGTVAADFKLGIHDRYLTIYGLVGYGMQSLSLYAIELGPIYGVGLSYNIIQDIAFKAEYRTQYLETSSADKQVANQSYTLSGFLVGLSYRY